MHGLFQVAPNHACRCWKPIPAEIVGCFSLQDLHTGGPACLFHFCAVPFHPGQTSFLGSSRKNITAPTYLLHGQNMVYGVWSFPIRDSWQWVHKSLLMDWWWEIIHHGTGTCPWNRGVGGPLAPPKKWVVLRRGTVHWGVSCLSALILTWTSSLRLQSQGFTTQSWCL